MGEETQPPCETCLNVTYQMEPQHDHVIHFWACTCCGSRFVPKTKLDEMYEAKLDAAIERDAIGVELEELQEKLNRPGE